MHPALLVLAYIGLTLAPLGLAYIQGKPPRPFRDELSSGLALTAFAILLIEFLLSGRFRIFSRRIGMDVTMRFHQLLARTATIFLLIHPFLYTIPFGLPRPGDTDDLNHLGLTGPSVLSGFIAWFLLAGFVVAAICRDQIGHTYERWRAGHAVGAVLIAALSAHHALSAGRYSADPALMIFWLALLAISGATISLVYVFRPLVRSRDPYVVKNVRRLALKTWEVELSRVTGTIPQFTAGQFVWLRIGCSAFSLRENPFSIASPPADRSRLSFIIKEQGDFTVRVGRTAPGTVAYVDGAYGNLTLERRSAVGIALIAGGVGVAPMLSILRQLRSEGDRRPIIFVYGNRRQEQVVQGQELQAMTDALNLTIVHVLSEPPDGWSGRTGMLDRALVNEMFNFDGADRWCFFLCGPPAMIDTVERALLEQGIPDRQIVSERFNYD